MEGEKPVKVEEMDEKGMVEADFKKAREIMEKVTKEFESKWETKNDGA